MADHQSQISALSPLIYTFTTPLPPHSRRAYTLATPPRSSLTMNEDLIERFRRNKGAHRSNKIQAEILLLPQKLNTRIRQYYEPAKKPSDAGPWLDRPEMPTSDEIMDIDSDNSSNPDIVEIVPNRETGGWESQGKFSRHSPAA